MTTARRRKRSKRTTTPRERELVGVVRWYLSIPGALCDCVPREDGQHDPYCMELQFRCALRVK